ncbi:MAG: putative ABC transporter permease [Lawsonibacter sp.]
MVWFWYFILYSFLGFLLEVVFAKVTGGSADRKCLIVLPLCPVYGLGACAILLLPRFVTTHPLLLFAFGTLTATAVEYLMALFYEGVLGVPFWNYRGLPGNIQGRVCIPFSLSWGVLALPLVYWVHPFLAPLLNAILLPVTILASLTLLSDVLLSSALLHHTRDRTCLKWYASFLISSDR